MYLNLDKIKMGGGTITMLPAFIAKSKGHYFWNWFVYSTFLFPIALIHSIFVKRIHEEVENTKMKDENL